MTLSALAILTGLVLAGLHIYALVKPAGYSAAAKRFPRSEAIGYALMGLGTLWFLYNINRDTIAEFASYKRFLLIGFGALGVLTCLYVKDFLAVRGLAVVLLLLSKLLLDKARWHDSDWRLLISALCYLWIIVSMWWVVSPWRARDFIQWLTSKRRRLQVFAGAATAMGVLMTLVGLLAF